MFPLHQVLLVDLLIHETKTTVIVITGKYGTVANRLPNIVIISLDILASLVLNHSLAKKLLIRLHYLKIEIFLVVLWKCINVAKAPTKKYSPILLTPLNTHLNSVRCFTLLSYYKPKQYVMVLSIYAATATIIVVWAHFIGSLTIFGRLLLGQVLTILVDIRHYNMWQNVSLRL